MKYGECGMLFSFITFSLIGLTIISIREVGSVNGTFFLLINNYSITNFVCRIKKPHQICVSCVIHKTQSESSQNYETTFCQNLNGGLFCFKISLTVWIVPKFFCNLWTNIANSSTIWTVSAECKCEAFKETRPEQDGMSWHLLAKSNMSWLPDETQDIK